METFLGPEAAIPLVSTVLHRKSVILGLPVKSDKSDRSDWLRITYKINNDSKNK